MQEKGFQGISTGGGENNQHVSVCRWYHSIMENDEDLKWTFVLTEQKLYKYDMNLNTRKTEMLIIGKKQIQRQKNKRWIWMHRIKSVKILK